MAELTSDLVNGVALVRQRLSNLAWERGLGISTRGVIAVEHPDAGHYATMNYSRINHTLAVLELDRDDVFVDIGSGKGRVLCCAARSAVRRVVGVDLSAQLNEEARQNARRARGLRAPIEVHTVLADEFDYSECTAYFLFSPFGAETVDKVLTKIRADRDGRPVRIAYANPAYQDAFAQHTWLETYATMDRAHRHEEHSVVFYRSLGNAASGNPA